MQSADPRRWTALAVIALAQFMVTMDTSIIGVALPEIQTDLGFSPAFESSWSSCTLHGVCHSSLSMHA